MDDLLLLLFPSSIPIFPLLHKRQWLRCQSLQKNVSKRSVTLTGGETTDSIFLCDEEGVCYKGRGCYGDAFPDRRSKSTIFCSSCRLQRFSSFFISWPLKAAQEDEAVTFTIF